MADEGFDAETKLADQGVVLKKLYKFGQPVKRIAASDVEKTLKTSKLRIRVERCIVQPRAFETLNRTIGSTQQTVCLTLYSFASF